MVSKMISLQDVQAARERIDKYVKRTPTVRSRTLSEMLAASVYLKLEVFQTTGAFKIRWLATTELNFSRVSHLLNSLNDDQPVLIGRDGQEISTKSGADLCKMLSQQQER